MSWNGLRVRAIGAKTAGYLVVALVALTLLGGYLTYGTYVDPGTEEETIEESSWSSTAQYTHHSIVQTQTDVFDEGTVLENRPAYLASLSPVLNGTHEYRYRASDGGELSVTVEQTRVLRSVGDDGAFEYWREEAHLSSHTVDSVEPGERVTVPFSVNVTEASQRVDEIEAQLRGTPGTTEMYVETELSLDGTRNGQQLTNQRAVHEMHIDDSGDVYSVETEQLTDSGEQVRQETVTATYGPLRTIGAPVLLLVSLLGALGLSIGHWQNRFEITDAEREWLAYQSALEEYDEWLSVGTIAHAALSRTTIRVETLEALVDVAIDSNRRVIHDRSRDRFAVLLEDTVYTFEPPKRPDTAGERTGPLAAADASAAPTVSDMSTAPTASDSDTASTIDTDDEQSIEEKEKLVSAVVSSRQKAEQADGEQPGAATDEGPSGDGADRPGVDTDEQTNGK